ncbi:MAG TPA: hypothetical protein VEJ18_03720, partial [Planctomycetota bacterium]|nr:hypothetical protein [Planctomycetota bacterium]
MIAHPLTPLWRWVLFPGLSVSLGALSGLMIRLPFLSWEWARFMALIAIAGAIGASTCKLPWMNFLMTPILGAVLSPLTHVYYGSFLHPNGWKNFIDSWESNIGHWIPLVACALGLLHHFHLRQPR